MTWAFLLPELIPLRYCAARFSSRISPDPLANLDSGCAITYFTKTAEIQDNNMNLPWLKTAIFWTIVLGIIFAVFQYTQKSENKQPAAALMHERLYQCARDLPPSQKALLRSIQQRAHAQLTQAEIMQLLKECENASPAQSKEFYLKRLKSLD